MQLRRATLKHRASDEELDDVIPVDDGVSPEEGVSQTDDNITEPVVAKTEAASGWEM